MNPVPQHRVRKCIQCRNPGCNKGRASCIWNRNIDIDRMMRGLPPLFEINRRYVLVLPDENEDERPRAGIKIGSDYIKEVQIVVGVDPIEHEECGICYTNQCTITTNCGHSYCRVCVQAQFVAIQNKSKAPECAFCRSCIVQLNARDESTHGIFTAFIHNVF